MSFDGAMFLVVNAIVLLLLIFKFKTIGKLKKVGIFFAFFIVSIVIMLVSIGMFGEPTSEIVQNLTLNYSKNAKNIEIIAIAEDKTKGKSYIVTAGFLDGEKKCEITMPVTRTGYNSWYAREATVNCKN